MQNMRTFSVKTPFSSNERQDYTDGGSNEISSPYLALGGVEFRRCVKVEVAVLGSRP